MHDPCIKKWLNMTASKSSCSRARGAGGGGGGGGGARDIGPSLLDVYKKEVAIIRQILRKNVQFLARQGIAFHARRYG